MTTPITVYAGARNAEPAARDALTFDALEHEIRALCEAEATVEDKRDLVAFGPYRLAEGATRSADAVESMGDVVMLDVDALDDVEALVGRLAGVDAIVHTTPSDDPTGDGPRKVRIYVRADAEHGPDDVAKVRLGVAAAIGVDTDPATLNADRIGFVGRLAGTPPRQVWRTRGAPIALASLPVVEAPSRSREAPPVADVAKPGAAAAAGIGAILAALGSPHDWAGSRWHIVGALAGVLRKADWPKNDALELVRSWLDVGDPAIEVAPALDWVSRTWERPPGDVSGEATLRGIVGTDVANAIGAGVLVPWRARRGAPATSSVEVRGLSDAGADREDWRRVRFADPDEPIDYRCPGLGLATSRGKVSVIAGQPGAGKGPLADHLALCLATGSPAFGRFPCHAAPTLLLDWEGVRLTMRRLRRMARSLGLDGARVDESLAVVDVSGCVDPLAETWQSDLADVVRRDGIRHLVIDSYTSAMLGTGVESVGTAYAELARLLGRLGVMVVCVTHANKASASAERPRLADVMGTGALGALAQTAIVVSRDDDRERVRVGCARAPETRFATFELAFVDGDDGSLGLVAHDAPAKADEDAPAGPVAPRPDADGVRIVRAGERVLAAARGVVGGLTWRALARASGEPDTRARAAIARLQAADLITQDASERFDVTAAGHAAGPDEVAAALGVVGGSFVAT